MNLGTAAQEWVGMPFSVCFQDPRQRTEIAAYTRVLLHAV